MTSGESSLPELSADQAAQSAAVLRALQTLIAVQGGWLPFDDYLRLVLYAPGLGYYTAGSTKFGASGDFVTAPELSDLFARCIANQCAPVLQSVGGDVLEFGAGSGRLAAGVLTRLAQLGCSPRHYYILEVSADLRARQQARLSSLPEAQRTRIRWLERPPEAALTGVLLANEVADALPFKRFRVDGAEVYECGVALDAAGALVDADRPAGSALRAEVQRVSQSDWPARYQSELCLMLEPWVATVAAALARGLLLLIDYGLPRHEYYHAQRDRGTLRCHFRHRAHDDPLHYPGLQDVTAWVDFTRVAEAAVDAQLEVAGFCTQAAFLLASGIEAETASANSVLQRSRWASEARSLLLPGEMGERFKVMALTRHFDGPLRGFALQDLRRSL